MRLFRESADAYLIIDEGTITDCNETSADLLKMKREDVIGLKPWEISPEYQRDGISSKEKAQMFIDEAIKNGNNRFEWIHKKSDGEVFWAEVVLTAIHNTDESSTILVTWRDISNRKQIEYENNRLVERLNLATENSHTGLWDWNIQTGNVEFNEEWAHICGYKLSELEPTNIDTWMELANPDDLEDSGRKLEAHWRGDTPYYECEARMKHRNGQWIWVLDRGKVVSWTEDGKPLRMIGTHTEITEIKKNNQKLKNAMEEARRMAEKAAEADKMKSQFLANISHEIRTPMNGVIGFLEMLKSTGLTKEQYEYIGEATSATEHMMQLINDLLDYSKMEAGETELEKIPFDLKKCVSEVMSLLGHRAARKELDFYGVVHSSIPSDVIGDPTRLKQILINLLNNAIKFTSQGEVMLDVREVQTDNEHVDEPSKNGTRIRFSIKDTGVGIPQKTMKSLFKPFMQADTSTTRLYGGTGLGLSICKKLVDLMEGEIAIESEVGRGTVFWFEIDMETTNVTLSSDQIVTELSIGEVLFACCDDSDESQVCKYINEVSSDIEIVNSKAAISEMIFRGTMKSYDIILIDAYMPNLNTVLIARELKSSSITRNTKLVLLCDQLGFPGFGKELTGLYDGFITRDASRSQLYQALNGVLNDEVFDDTPVTRTEPYDMSKLYDGYKPKILLAEDNEINQNLLLTYFEKKGVQCDIAVNGLEAVKAVQIEEYDLVLMDCQMPVLDGYSATRKIRSLDDVKDIPIVALTANAMKEEREKCLRSGMNDYLSKPLKFEALDALIRKYVQPKAGSQQVLGGNSDSFIDQAKNALMSSSSISEGDVEQIFALYLESLPKKLEDLRSSVDTGQYEGIVFLAHQLKGTSGNLRIKIIESKMRLLEEKAKEKDIDGCNYILNEVTNLFKNL